MVTLYTPTPEEVEAFALSRGDHNKIHSSNHRRQIVPGDWLITQYFLNLGSIPKDIPIRFEFLGSVKPNSEIFVDEDKIKNTQKDLVNITKADLIKTSPMVASMMMRKDFEVLDDFNPPKTKTTPLTNYDTFEDFPQRDYNLLDIITKLSGDLSGNENEEGLIEFSLKKEKGYENNINRLMAIYSSMSLFFNNETNNYQQFGKEILKPQIYIGEVRGNKIRDLIDVRTLIYGLDDNKRDKKAVGYIEKSLTISYKRSK